MNKIKITNILFSLSIIAIFLKAIISAITYDEARSFLNYVYVNNVFNIGVGTNHLLNTVLTYLTTFFSY